MIILHSICLEFVHKYVVVLKFPFEMEEYRKIFFSSFRKNSILPVIARSLSDAAISKYLILL